MDVTRGNFIEALAILESLLPTADFVSFDLEFTGLGDTRPSQLDTPAMRYATAYADAESFPPIQFGLSIFRRKTSNSPQLSPQQQTDQHPPPRESWQVIPFNFSIFPHAVYYPHNTRYPFLDRIIKVQASSVQFLTAHGLDFMSSFAHGVSWLRHDNEEKVRQHVSSILYKKRFGEKTSSTDLAKDDRHALDKFKSHLQFAMSKLEQYGLTPTPSQPDALPKVLAVSIPRMPVQRRIVYDYLREHHPCIVPTEQVSTIAGTHARLLLYPSAEHAQAKKKEIFEGEVETQVAGFVGFRLVIDAVRKCQTPIVVHNGLMDCVKLYANFINALPQDMDQFKAAMSQAFPSVFDTRWILHELSQTNDVLNKIMQADKVRSISETCTALEENWDKLCAERTSIIKTFVPIADVNRNKLHLGRASIVQGTENEGFEVTSGDSFNHEEDVHRFGRYAASPPGKYDHEAGFDAQETGHLFVLLRRLIQMKACSDDTLANFKNKIYLGSCGGYSSVDLDRIGNGEANEYLEKGNALVISGDWKGSPSPKQKDSPYHRCRHIMKKITEGTEIDGNASRISLIGPQAMLVVLEMKKDAAANGKRSREGQVVDDKFSQQLENVVAVGRSLGLSVQTYGEKIGSTQVASKRRKFG